MDPPLGMALPCDSACRSAVLARAPIFVQTGQMHGRQPTIALVGAAVVVVINAVLAIAKFADGAWVQGSLWAASSLVFAIAYGSSLMPRRRT